MTARLYLGHNVHDAIINFLRSEGIDCLRAEDDQHARATDELILERSTSLGRVLLMHDYDFAKLHAQWLKAVRTDAGIIHVNVSGVSSRTVFQDIAAALSAPNDDFTNVPERLPL